MSRVSCLRGRGEAGTAGHTVGVTEGGVAHGWVLARTPSAEHYACLATELDVGLLCFGHDDATGLPDSHEPGRAWDSVGDGWQTREQLARHTT